MKNKIVATILGISLVLSVIGNIYLVKTMTDTKGEVNALSSQLVSADNQIVDLQEQLTGLTALQIQVNDLQEQLTKSKEQIESLESTIAENTATNVDSEGRLAEEEQSLPETQEQAQTASSQNSSSASTSSNNNSSGYDPFVGMPGYEGPKPGFIFIPGYGYDQLPEDLEPGSGMIEEGSAPAYEECIYDENGNCTIHQHRGDM